MNRILVPTDFSQQSDSALDVALGIARKSGASLHLYHVIESPDYPEITDIMAFQSLGDMNILEKIEERLKSLVDDDRCRDIETTYSIEAGSPYEQITRKAQAEGSDLIVIGSHGKKGIDRFLIGSTTEKVIQNASGLVLTIKEPLSYFSPSSIVFGSNFYGEIAEGFKAMQRFADLYSATVHLLKVNTRSHFETTRYSRQLMERFAEEQKLANYTINIYNDDSEEEGILNFAADCKADMICVPTHGKTGLSHLVSGSIAENISEQALRPVLTYKIKPLKISYGVIGPFR
ncbi:universal stress protein [Prosthecochloris sp. HL-130-GSB]|jgi:nucleotide-binding universal stress UspA family protein|uniref:universal stress protein n=1 Tax=Prosthecochloris sp. HL-130-GSB TaxID=1974213 RepID=UPI000A1C1844|nr:universal stress protein [Prosthecochloris sp. HL-130-GSB]ARM30186.1 universal stress protein UspA [Prosthecochloris sp. HL-130-GSB]